MRRFEQRQIREALAHAAEGGQALHIWDPGPHAAQTYPNAPAVFLQNRPWAHLIDDDLERLTATARRLGVRRVFVDRRGQRGQHVDLCGGPLDKALAECGRDTSVQLGLAL